MDEFGEYVLKTDVLGIQKRPVPHVWACRHVRNEGHSNRKQVYECRYEETGIHRIVPYHSVGNFFHDNDSDEGGSGKKDGVQSVGLFDKFGAKGFEEHVYRMKEK